MLALNVCFNCRDILNDMYLPRHQRVNHICFYEAKQHRLNIWLTGTCSTWSVILEHTLPFIQHYLLSGINQEIVHQFELCGFTTTFLFEHIISYPQLIIMLKINAEGILTYVVLCKFNVNAPMNSGNTQTYFGLCIFIAF